MKLILIGSNGSIARRYCAVLDALRISFDSFDDPTYEPFTQSFDGYTHAIIASPTNTHISWIDQLTPKFILCEKPVSKNPEAIAARRGNHGLYVVNNYQFLPCANVKKKIAYDFYNTGRDGLIWDVCQLVYLAWKNKVELEVKRRSFWWDCKWGQHQVVYHEIEKSYYHMLKAFLSGDTSNLWDMNAALKMSELCADLYKKGGNCEHFIWRPKGSCRNTSEDRFYSFSKEGPAIDWAQGPH